MDYKQYKINIFDLIICGPKTDYIPGENVIKHIEEHGIWAPLETNYLIYSLRQSDKNNLTFIDVGSNSGYFTLIALKMGFNVIAIEANPIHKQYLMKSIELNNLDSSKLTYIEKFVSDNITTTQFDGWTGIDKIKSDKNNCFEVSNIALDDLINEEIFLKVDVEGAEPQVFRSALKSFNNNKIKYIMFEITYIIEKKMDNEQIEMLHFLKKNGYYLYDIIGNNYNEIKDINVSINNWKKQFSNIIKNNHSNIKTCGTNIVAQKSPFVIK